MRTREETVEYLHSDDIHMDNTKGSWHFGNVELRKLLDFIFEGPPANEQQEFKGLQDNT